MRLPTPAIQQLFALGVQGYVAEDEPPENIREAVRTVAGEKIYLHPDKASELSAATLRQTARAHTAEEAKRIDGELKTITTRLALSEREMLKRIGLGLANDQIAKEMFLSVKTIETYRTRVRRKLQLKNQTDVAQLAWRYAHPA